MPPKAKPKAPPKPKAARRSRPRQAETVKQRVCGFYQVDRHRVEQIRRLLPEGSSFDGTVRYAIRYAYDHLIGLSLADRPAAKENGR